MSDERKLFHWRRPTGCRIVVFSRWCLAAVRLALDELAYDCDCSAPELQDCYALDCPLRRIEVELRT